MFFVRMVRVPSGSMMNTVLPGDRLLVTKVFGTIERGEIVVFQYPEDSTYYLARVVGLPGETIQVRGHEVYINERLLDEQKVVANSKDDRGEEPFEEISTEGSGPYRVFFTQPPDQVDDLGVDANFGVATPFRIPANSFFMLGDNRDNSFDSRHRGAVPRELIWGSSTVIYMSTPLHSEDVRWNRVMKRIR